MNDVPEILRVRDLNVTFPTESGAVHAVRGLSFALREREVLAIVGESGSGKSVSALAVLGLLSPSARVSGQVTFRGTDVLTMRPAQLRSLRGRRIAMIFQDPRTALNPVHTIGDQLVEAVRAHEPVPRRQALARAEELLGLVRIPQPRLRLRSYPHEFSGGMLQRVLIAMAVINDPDVIIADEPTTALDVTVQAQVLQTLMAVKDEVGAAIVLISHDLGVVAGAADRVLVMYAGRGVESAGVDDLFYSPRMPYTAGLLASMPTGGGARLRPIGGAPPSLIDLPPGCSFSPRCPLVSAECREREPELAATDNLGQFAACHRWRTMAGLRDPLSVFGPSGLRDSDEKEAG